MISDLDHVQIAAPPGSEAAARGFYGDLLGLVELEKPPPLAVRGGVWFALGDRELHIGIEEDFVAARKAHPGFALPDARSLHELAASLEAAGLAVRWDSDLSGVARFYVEDPFGNRLELLARST